ncbi:MAG: metal transporter [Flavobacteriales bacterium MED-G15]|nr:MAG: metal transporter [Flavobacteriales bacterium MED-G15]
MKKILIILLLLPLTMAAQEDQKKVTKAQFTVDGNCKMCKKTIEKAALSVKGVEMASWDVPSNQLSLVYDPNKAELDAVHMAVAKSGYDTSEVKAKEKDYEALPNCCQYDRKEL